MTTQLMLMREGFAHLAAEPDLSDLRLHCREMLFDYNNLLRPSEKAKKTALIKKILGKTGQTIKVNSPFFCDYGFQIEVGENFFANAGCTMLDTGGIRIGDNVLFGPNVSLYTVDHPLDVSLRNESWEHGRKIIIGNNVWVGGSVTILAGITIGDNTVIGAGAVVTKDIPANSLAVGNPCRVLREITDADRQFYLTTYMKND
ncbi:sugar O-acetyltransferase [Exercitatus varius]|uniref:sugar O-acetyltransferase n=1 Tax=Exercitatus varius TaxID=67857 RepID=UPI0018A3C482|nr:sugar O-acetyltransferase [Exercitatus varius]MDG2943026.1 sugar O-acetyltransferase [Exercitatus varius]QOF67125.1 sugar O-acetyltransferase [Actinobacillus sp. GY-402]